MELSPHSSPPLRLSDSPPARETRQAPGTFPGPDAATARRSNLERLRQLFEQLMRAEQAGTDTMQSFRWDALAYILQLLERGEIREATAHARSLSDSGEEGKARKDFSEGESRPVALQKIALPTLEGFELIAPEHIIRCASESNYTSIFLKAGRRMVVSRTLKEVAELLKEYPFLRVHHSHLINVNEIIRYVRGEGGYVVMSDQSNVPVSRSRKEVLLRLFSSGSASV